MPIHACQWQLLCIESSFYPLWSPKPKLTNFVKNHVVDLLLCGLVVRQELVFYLIHAVSSSPHPDESNLLKTLLQA